MAKSKVFKSGNSSAVRLPASFGAVPGTLVEVREEQGRWIVEALPPEPSKIDISGFAGSMPWLKPLSDDDRLFEERELDWEGKHRPRG
ncbi:hypothetical protein IP88_10690 [alpha proteobacterium AAP81b]|nr:hypothetical protein IP88_10690 [alpha proteobacterium AAP81b]